MAKSRPNDRPDHYKTYKEYKWHRQYYIVDYHNIKRLIPIRNRQVSESESNAYFLLSPAISEARIYCIRFEPFDGTALGCPVFIGMLGEEY